MRPSGAFFYIDKDIKNKIYKENKRFFKKTIPWTWIVDPGVDPLGTWTNIVCDIYGWFDVLYSDDGQIMFDIRSVFVIQYSIFVLFFTIQHWELKLLEEHHDWSYRCVEYWWCK